jgi:outer membrane receptor protein involved in Fe transport
VTGAFAHYEINPKADVYLDTMFSDDRTFSQVAPSGAFIGTGLFSGNVHVNCDNPLMSAAQQSTFCAGLAPTDDVVMRIGRRDIEGGPRIDDLRHTAYKIDLGVKGDLGGGWSYDSYLQYGITIYNENFSNEWSVSRVQNALEVVDVGGVPTCKVVVENIDPKCVPLDVFAGLGSLSPASLAYVKAQGFKTGYTREAVANLSITGDLGQYGVKSPWAGSGVSIAFGGEYRREGLQLDTSRDFQLNDLYGQGAATLPVPSSSFQVKEGFTELRAPIVEDMPAFHSLTADLQARYSDYSTAGTTWTYAAKLDWAPISDFRFRASYQRAVRAPNILELFTPERSQNFSGQDPCSSRGGLGPLFTLAQCENTGVTPGQYGSSVLDCVSSQCKELTGGNTALKPEKADTYSAGIVLTPHFIHGFTATIDWFSIKLNNEIATIPPQTAVQQCALTASPLFCSLVHRDAFGTIGSDVGYVIATNVNTGFLKTSGIDFGAQYRVNLSDWHLGDHGSLAFSFNGTYTHELVNEPVPGLGTYDCAGLYGGVCANQFNGPTPQWRHTLRITWNSPWKVALSANWRYISSVGISFNPANNGNNPLLNTGNVDVHDAHIPAYSWFDLAGTWAIKEGMTLRFGVNNILDKDPPIVDSNAYPASGPPFGNGNTFPGTYDALGRQVFVGITADF